MTDFSRAAILITGGARRVGRYLATALASDGHPVVIHFNRSGEEAAQLAAELVAAGGSAATVGADLNQESEVNGLWAKACEAIGRSIPILINNASLFQHDDVVSAERTDWDRHLNVNSRAPFNLIQQLAQGLAPDQSGLVINMVDQRVWKPNPNFMTYTLSKAALWHLTRTMAQALAPRIRIMGIGPGPVLASVHQQQSTFDQEAAAVPLGRGPELSEIAGAVRFIMASPSLTGQMIALDGGQHLAWQTPDVMMERADG